MVCGQRIAIEYEDLGALYGKYDRDECKIKLHSETPADKQPLWKTHETLHALLEGSGVLYATAAIFGIKRKDPRIDAWEEAVIRILSPHILETFGAPRRVR